MRVVKNWLFGKTNIIKKCAETTNNVRRSGKERESSRKRLFRSSFSLSLSLSPSFPFSLASHGGFSHFEAARKTLCLSLSPPSLPFTSSSFCSMFIRSVSRSEKQEEGRRAEESERSERERETRILASGGEKQKLTHRASPPPPPPPPSMSS